jgi:3-oxoacyl-[acyl-carrier-protein] synthase II
LAQQVEPEVFLVLLCLGSVEAIFSLLALYHGVVPPTLNLDRLDPALQPQFNYVPHYAQEKKLTAVLSNSFGFGGTNASLVFSRV